MPPKDRPRLHPELVKLIGSAVVSGEDRESAFDRVCKKADELGIEWPRRDTFLNRYRDAKAKRDQVEVDWSMRTSPEKLGRALPEILSVWQWHLVGNTPYTVRQAEWVSRLRSLVTVKQYGKEWRTYALAKKALAYSQEELASLVLKEEPFDTSLLDLDALREGSADLAEPTGKDWTVFRALSEVVQRKRGYAVPNAFRARLRRETFPKGSGIDIKASAFDVLDEAPAVLDPLAHDVLQVAHGAADALFYFFSPAASKARAVMADPEVAKEALEGAFTALKELHAKLFDPLKRVEAQLLILKVRRDANNPDAPWLKKKSGQRLRYIEDHLKDIRSGRYILWKLGE